MSFLRRLLGGGTDDTDRPSQRGSDGEDDIGLLVATEATFDAHAERHRVSVWLRLVDPSFENEREQQRVFAIEDRVMRALDRAGAGEHDTNSLETGFFAMRLIGEDADAIVAIIAPLLDAAPAGSYLAVRRGPAGSPEDRIEVGAAR